MVKHSEARNRFFRSVVIKKTYQIFREQSILMRVEYCYWVTLLAPLTIVRRSRRFKRNKANELRNKAYKHLLWKHDKAISPFKCSSAVGLLNIISPTAFFNSGVFVSLENIPKEFYKANTDTWLIQWTILKLQHSSY